MTIFHSFGQDNQLCIVITDCSECLRADVIANGSCSKRMQQFSGCWYHLERWRSLQTELCEVPPAVCIPLAYDPAEVDFTTHSFVFVAIGIGLAERKPDMLLADDQVSVFVSQTRNIRLAVHRRELRPRLEQNRLPITIEVGLE